MLLPIVSALLLQLPTAPITFQDGVLTPPMIGHPGAAALNFANSRRAELGLDARSKLVVGKMLSTRLGGVVHLSQQVDGLELQGRKSSSASTSSSGWCGSPRPCEASAPCRPPRS